MPEIVHSWGLLALVAGLGYLLDTVGHVLAPEHTALWKGIVGVAGPVGDRIIGCRMATQPGMK